MPGATGAPGPSGAPGTTLTTVNQLGGLACTFNGATGTTIVSFDASGRATLTCATGTTPSPAQLSIAPASHSFGSVPVGSSANASFTVTNTGGSATGILGTTTSAPFAIVGSNCTGSLAPAETCSVTVAFSPTAGGPVNGSLDVSASPGGAASASLSGSGASAAGPAVLSVTPTNYSFGNVTVGTTSNSTPFTVINNGGSPTGALGITFSSPHFTVNTTTCVGSLAPAATCTIVVRFAPATGGTLLETMTVSGSGGPTVVAGVAGTGVTLGALTISPTSQSFGSITLGSSSPNLGFTVSNVGGSAVNLVPPTVSGPNASTFQIMSSSCTGSLGPGSSCGVSLRFTPTASGPASATLSVGAFPGGTVTAALSGTGASAGTAFLTVNPSSLSFGTVVIGTNRDFSTTVTNGGTAPSGTVTPTITGPNASAFTVIGSTCAAPLNPTQSCTITVRYTPAAVGAASATLTAAASPGGSAVASLNGTGAPPATLQITPDIYSFGSVIVGQFREASFEIANIGGSSAGAINIGALAAPYSVPWTSCPNGFLSSLPPGASCNVTVRFDPVVPGGTTATLSVTGSAGGAATADLSGTGERAPLNTHFNGFGGFYEHANPLGVPGIPGTYTVSMAFAAAQSVFPGGSPFTVGCGAFPAVQMNAFGVWYTWGYAGDIAGYAVSSTGAPLCPDPLDRTWN